MVKRLLFLALFFTGTSLVAQDSLGVTAKTFMRQGDYANAILVLNRALEKDRTNIELKKDLALAYYMQRDFSRSMETIKPVADGKDGDVQTYQLLGMVYKAIEEAKEAEKMYRAALKKFPQSGVLHSEYGEMLWSRQEFTEAVKLWRKGIENDPGYSGNYYHAAKYYYLSADKVWGLIYGEIFVNLESYSKRTPEIKTLLLEGYKKLFTDVNLLRKQDEKNTFLTAFLETMRKQSQLVETGITVDALAALRTRFILEWFDKNAMRFPFRLFDYQQQLAKSGMFEAYNQWIFGAADNLTAFQQWTVTHSEEYNKFATFQKNRVFKVPAGQFYQGEEVSRNSGK